MPVPRLDADAPWKRRFRATAVVWTQLAKADPTRGLAVTNLTGARQLYAWDVPSGELRQITYHPEGKLSGALAPDGRHIYYLEDESGNEIGHLVRVPFESGEPQDITPDLAPYSVTGIGFSRDGRVALMSIADQDGFHVYRIDVGPGSLLGRPIRLYHSSSFIAEPILSHHGDLGIVHTTERSLGMQFSLVALDTSDGKRLGELWDGVDASVSALGFSAIAGDKRVLATSNKSGYKRPFLWDIDRGERTNLPLEDVEGELEVLDWSDDAEQVLLSHSSRATQQLLLYGLEKQQVKALDHPAGAFGVSGGALGQAAYFGPEEAIYAHWQDATHPLQLIALDGDTGAIIETVLSAGEVPPGHRWRNVSFESSDGQSIQGWLGLPGAADDGPYPAIVHMHGGPWVVMTETFHPVGQMWLDHGFVFLTINYRGSTTFGREYQEMIRGNAGYWELEDVVAARDWLVETGMAHPRQILLTGGSYGGYLTLLALGKRPRLWAGGMALVTIADWAVQYEHSSEMMKGVARAYFGGSPEDKPEAYARSSPITYAEQVEAPVLIIQGRNDTRTPARPVEQYERKLKGMGKPVQVHWFEAGHMGAGMEKEIEHAELMLRFAYDTLGLITQVR